VSYHDVAITLSQLVTNISHIGRSTYLIEQHHLVGGTVFGQDQGPIDLVILRWFCQGLSQVDTCQTPLDPKLNLFWELIYILQYL
jgi:hypothetical protein